MKRQLSVVTVVSALVLAGCGGDGNYTYTPPSISGVINTTSTMATATADVAAATDPSTGLPIAQSTTMTYRDPATGGTVSQSVIVPAGISIHTGDTVALLPRTLPVPIGGGSVSDIKTRALTPYELYYSTDGGTNYTDSGLLVSQGRIQTALSGQFVAFPYATNSMLDLFVDGPFDITLGTDRLTVNRGFDLHIENFSNLSYPTQTTFKLPANSTGANPQYLTSASIDLKFSTPQTAGGVIDLSFNSVTKTFVVPANPGGALTFSFSDPKTDPADQIPTSGIDRVTVKIGTTVAGQKYPTGS